MADDALKALITEAMFRALDEKKREELLKSALANLVTPSQVVHGYGATRSGPSPLEDAFAVAVRQVAFDIVKEMMTTSEARERVRALVADAFEKLVTDRDRLSTALADAIVTAMQSR